MSARDQEQPARPPARVPFQAVDLPPEDRCTLTEGCDALFETTIVGWAGGTGWVFDACWACARRTIDVMSGWAA